jgi:hypothetical protein
MKYAHEMVGVDVTELLQELLFSFWPNLDRTYV